MEIVSRRGVLSAIAAGQLLLKPIPGSERLTIATPKVEAYYLPATDALVIKRGTEKEVLHEAMRLWWESLQIRQAGARK